MKAVFRKAVCFVLVIAVFAVSLSACSFRRTDSAVSALNNNINPGAAAAGALHNTSVDDLDFVAASGLIELYYDARTCSVAVYDTSADHYWTALPAFPGNSAAMLSAVLISDDGRYYLNSQDNCVAFSACRAEFSSDGLTLTYTMTEQEDAAVGESADVPQGELCLSVAVRFTLADGSLTVDIPADEILVSDGYALESLTLMPDFGAISYSEKAVNAEALFYPDRPEQESETATEDAAEETTGDDEEETTVPALPAEAKKPENTPEDFLLVPDGCGAIMFTRADDTSTERVSFRVFGDETLEEGKTAQVPAFGIKKDNAAFVAVIGEGADGALIKANRGGADIDGVNRVCAEFPISYVRSDGEKTYIAPASDRDISVCYRFMSGSEAGYMSMAASCREYLIRKGLLSSKSVSYAELPLNVAVIGSVDGGYGTVVSELEATEELVSVIKAKGVNSANIVLQGYFDGGMLQDASADVSAMNKTGGGRAFDALCDYALKQKFNVFAGLNILTAASDGDCALTLTGKPVSVSFRNPLSPYVGKSTYPLRFLSAAKIEKNVISLMNSARGLNISGFCINDAAKYAYADRVQNGASAAELSDIVAENVSAFAIQQELMLSGCNFSVIKDASFLLDVPFCTQYDETDAYMAVPFIPAILHSTVGYSGTPANVSELPTLELLKCVEYGGIPYFEWVLSMKSHLYYGLKLAEAVEFSLRAASELSDLSGARMISHERIENGVYATGFDCGSVVYVNYNNYSVTVGNLTVSPYDFIRLN